MDRFNSLQEKSSRVAIEDEQHRYSGQVMGGIWPESLATFLDARMTIGKRSFYRTLLRLAENPIERVPWDALAEASEMTNHDAEISLLPIIRHSWQY